MTPVRKHGTEDVGLNDRTARRLSLPWGFIALPVAFECIQFKYLFVFLQNNWDHIGLTQELRTLFAGLSNFFFSLFNVESIQNLVNKCMLKTKCYFIKLWYSHNLFEPWLQTIALSNSLQPFDHPSLFVTLLYFIILIILLCSDYACIIVVEAIRPLSFIVLFLKSFSLWWRHNGHDGVWNTSLTIVYSTVYSGADQRKYQSSASLAFVRGIHWGPVNSPHKWPVTRKMFPFDDVIVIISNMLLYSHYSWCKWSS